MNMPRGKRRINNISLEERLVTKRPRTTAANNVDPATINNTGSQSNYLAIAQSIQPAPQQNTSSRRSRAHEHNFDQKKCLTWFREYTTPNDLDMLGPEGMERFCEDLNVEPENIVMLVLAYKMGAANMGYFKQTEWLHGLSRLECDSLTKLKRKLSYLKSLLNDPNCFKSIYRYAYDFAKDSDQRSMDVNTAKAMLELLLGKQWILHQEFSKFLEQSKYKVINKDQWCNILEFSRIINTDLKNYDIDGAWPVILDEFVEWLRQKGEFSLHNEGNSNLNTGDTNS